MFTNSFHVPLSIAKSSITYHSGFPIFLSDPAVQVTYQLQVLYRLQQSTLHSHQEFLNTLLMHRVERTYHSGVCSHAQLPRKMLWLSPATGTVINTPLCLPWPSQMSAWVSPLRDKCSSLRWYDHESLMSSCSTCQLAVSDAGEKYILEWLSAHRCELLNRYGAYSRS